MCVADPARARHGNLGRIGAEVGHPEVAEQNAAVGMGIRPHAPIALGGKLGELRLQAALAVKELLRPVAPHPVFQKLEVLGMGGRVGERHLVSTKGAFNLQAVYHLWARPALWRIEDDHRPARAGEVAADTGILLDSLDLFHGLVEGRGHGLMHWPRLVSLHENWGPAVAAEQLFQFLARDSCEDGRIGNLVAVEV